MMNASRYVSTLAGSLYTPTFIHPTALYADQTGNVYVSDSGNNMIKVLYSISDIQPYISSLEWSYSPFNVDVPPTFTISTPSLAIRDKLGYPVNGAKVLLNFYIDAFCSESALVDMTGGVTWSNAEGIASFSNLTIASAGTFYYQASSLGALSSCSSEYAAIVTVAIPTLFSARVLTGSGAASYINGPGVLASFNRPSAAVFDLNNNLLVADTSNQAIRLISPGGLVSTFAGSAASVNLVKRQSYLQNPVSLVSSLTGIYILDSNTHSIFQATSAGAKVEKLVGSGVAGFQDGPLSSASFSGPMGLTTGPPGVLFVADSGNRRIRKVDLKAGYVSTIAVSLTDPRALILDNHNNLYVADSHCVRFFSGTGQSSIFAGSLFPGFLDGFRTNALFNNISGVALDSSGALYLSDQANHAIRKVNESGHVSTVGGSLNGIPGYLEGLWGNTLFNSPAGLCIDNRGNLIVVDSGNNRIRTIFVNVAPAPISSEPDSFQPISSTKSNLLPPSSSVFATTTAASPLPILQPSSSVFATTTAASPLPILQPSSSVFATTTAASPIATSSSSSLSASTMTLPSPMPTISSTSLSASTMTPGSMVSSFLM